MIRAANDKQFGRKWRRDWAYSSGIWSDLGSVFYQTVIGECLVLVFSIVVVYQTLCFCVVFTLSSGSFKKWFWALYACKV